MCVCVLCKIMRKNAGLGRLLSTSPGQQPTAVRAPLRTTTSVCTGSCSAGHRMTAGFGPFKLPSRGHLWKQAGPLPLARSPAANKVRRSHLCSILGVIYVQHLMLYVYTCVVQSL